MPGPSHSTRAALWSDDGHLRAQRRDHRRHRLVGAGGLDERDGDNAARRRCAGSTGAREEELRGVQGQAGVVKCAREQARVLRVAARRGNSERWQLRGNGLGCDRARRKEEKNQVLILSMLWSSGRHGKHRSDEFAAGSGQRCKAATRTWLGDAQVHSDIIGSFCSATGS